MKRVGNAFKGILGGFVIILIGIVLLWWNEGNNVRNLKTTAEMDKVVIDVLDRAENFKSFAKDIQLYMVELERKYRGIVENDKIRMIQEDVDDVKVDIKRNLDKMLTNIDMVSNLEEKSHALKDMAKEYKIGGKELKRASWRKKKYTIVAGGLGIGAFVYFGLRFFLKWFILFNNNDFIFEFCK